MCSGWLGWEPMPGPGTLLCPVSPESAPFTYISCVSRHRKLSANSIWTEHCCFLPINENNCFFFFFK